MRAARVPDRLALAAIQAQAALVLDPLDPVAIPAQAVRVPDHLALADTPAAVVLVQGLQDPVAIPPNTVRALRIRPRALTAAVQIQRRMVVILVLSALVYTPLLERQEVLGLRDQAVTATMVTLSQRVCLLPRKRAPPSSTLGLVPARLAFLNRALVIGDRVVVAVVTVDPKMCRVLETMTRRLCHQFKVRNPEEAQLGKVPSTQAPAVAALVAMGATTRLEEAVHTRTVRHPTPGKAITPSSPEVLLKGLAVGVGAGDHRVATEHP